MRTLIVAALAVALSGCTSSGIIGGGKPTTVVCKGKGNVAAGAYAFQADCGDGFSFKINVQ